MTFGTDARGAVNDLELVLKTKKKRDKQKHIAISS